MFLKYNCYFLSASSNPLSYSACQEFATQFDGVYRLRDNETFVHPNPMLRSPDADLDEDETTLRVRIA